MNNLNRIAVLMVLSGIVLCDIKIVITVFRNFSLLSSLGLCLVYHGLAACFVLREYEIVEVETEDEENDSLLNPPN